MLGLLLFAREIFIGVGVLEDFFMVAARDKLLGIYNLQTSFMRCGMI